jgi:hypothetical protein
MDGLDEAVRERLTKPLPLRRRSAWRRTVGPARVAIAAARTDKERTHEEERAYSCPFGRLTH